MKSILTKSIFRGCITQNTESIVKRITEHVTEKTEVILTNLEKNTMIIVDKKIDGLSVQLSVGLVSFGEALEAISSAVSSTNSANNNTTSEICLQHISALENALQDYKERLVLRQGEDIDQHNILIREVRTVMPDIDDQLIEKLCKAVSNILMNNNCSSNNNKISA